jgi:hypothetical protein
MAIKIYGQDVKNKNNKREPEAKCVGTQYSQPTHICDMVLLLLLCKFAFTLRLH